jgi:competence protein ComEC
MAVALALGIAARWYPVAAFGVVVLAAVPWRWSLIGVAMFVLGWWLAGSPRSPVVERGYWEGTGTVVSMPRQTEFGFQFDFDTSQGRYRVSAPMAPVPSARYEVKAVVSPFDIERRESEARRGFLGRMRWHTGGYEHVAEPNRLQEWAYAWRQSFREFTAAQFSPPTRALLDGMVFNADEDIDKLTARNLRDTGTFHVVSASGLHVSAFAVALGGAMALAGLPWRMRTLILGGVLTLYTAAAGFEPAIIRSSLMMGFGLAAVWSRHVPDFMSGLAVAAMVLLLRRPADLFDPGFQLSVAITAVLGAAFESVSRPQDHWAATTLRAGTAAWVGGAPLTAHWFGTFSWVGIPANLLVGPAVTLIVPGMLLAHAANGFWPAGAQVLARAMGTLADGVAAAAEALATIPMAMTAVPRPSGILVVLIYVAAYLAWRPPRVLA